jgi:IMP dehydrogenase
VITFDNITLVPRKKSDIPSRSSCHTTMSIFGREYDLPIIASPMPDVCNGKMALTLAERGMLGIIHRFQSIEQEVEEYLHAAWLPTTNHTNNPACAIGVTGDFEERFLALAANGCRIFCLDTANGFNSMVGRAVEQIRLAWSTFKESQNERIFIIAGNVASKEGYEYLANLGVDAVRVGMAGGSVCETKTETGVYRPTLDSVWEIYRFRENAILASQSRGGYPWPAILADGGIRIPADVCKAIACGADGVICGSVFAGTKESPGEPIALPTGKVKLYRGAASYSVQQESGKKPLYNEGRETFTPYVGRVEKVIERFKSGLQSSMSMMNATDWKTFRENVSVERL